jgi:hypothetical protein
MEEINCARQESSARSSPIASSEEVAKAVFGRTGSASEDKEDESTRREYRCRVCDGPVEWPDLVCRECWRRDRGPPTQYSRRRTISSERPMLIVLCGPPHTGKSASTRKLPGGFTIISSDEIRKRLAGSFRSSKDKTKV